MRGRPATPLGTWGTINAAKTDHGWQASTYMRLYTGKSVRVRASAKTKTAAITALKARCAQRLQATDTDTLTSTSTLNQLITTWIDSKDDVTEQTLERYRGAIDRHIAPGIGEIRINEITPALMDRWVRDLTPGQAHNAMSVLKGAFGMAVRYGLLTTSPIQHVKPRKATKKKVDALSPEEMQAFRGDIKKHANGLTNGHTADLLRDVTDIAICTGLRLGEILAIRWEDIDGDTLHVCGTVVFTKGDGNHRQPFGKTETSDRVVQLPHVAQKIIARRRDKWGDIAEMLFPSVRLTYMSEANFNRIFRPAKGERWAHVTIHTLRRTLATIVNAAMGPRKAADLLGHADMSLTQRVYIARSDQGVAVGDLVDDLLGN